jgi:AraC family transcriptional regulator
MLCPGKADRFFSQIAFFARRRQILRGESIMQLRDQGAAKYGANAVLASSAATGWQRMVAEHRHHSKAEIDSFRPQHLEIVIATGCHQNCVASRTGDRIRQHTRVEPGTIWFCPVGVHEENIILSNWHEALHLYLPTERFAELSDARGGGGYRPESVPYLGGFFDEQIRRIGSGLLGQMRAPSAAGAARIDTLALELTARVVDSYSTDARATSANERQHRLDPRRLRRVLDYMTTHLEDDVGLEDLAREASFSTFHFVRVFANTMGMPPHRYLSRMRLERAKTLLSLRTMPIAEIALACCFSSQANFTRAFVRATGSTPKEYQRQSR